jgi:hypothetical protein
MMLKAISSGLFARIGNPTVLQPASPPQPWIAPERSSLIYKPTHSLASESLEVNFSGKSSMLLYFVVPY